MRRAVLALVPAVLLLAACGSSTSGAGSSPSSSPLSPSPSATCTKDSLQTLTAGKLTIASGEPAFEPWMVENKPENGKGYESAVAYAVAKALGYSDADVTWVRTTFDGAIAPGPKKFDVNIQQYSITDERKKAVDFSSSYYDVSQAVVSYKGSPADGVTTVAGLKDAKLGAAIGTTSLKAINDQIQPTNAASVYNDNAAAVTALKNKQIDAIVVDVPTAFYLAAAEIDNGIIVGQLPNSSSAQEQLGLQLAKSSPLTASETSAVDAIKADGTLAKLADQWLAQAGAPVLS